MTVFWSNKHQTFGKGKSNYVLNVLSSDIELGIYLTTGLMMNHPSQNLFNKLKLAYGVFVRDLARKKTGNSSGTQAAFVQETAGMFLQANFSFGWIS